MRQYDRNRKDPRQERYPESVRFGGPEEGGAAWGRPGFPGDQNYPGGQTYSPNQGTHDPPGGGQGYGGGGYGYPVGGYAAGAYGSAGEQQGYGGRGYVDEPYYGNAGQWGASGGRERIGHGGAAEGQSGSQYGGAGGMGSGGVHGEGPPWLGTRDDGGSQYGQPGSYGPRDSGGRQGWGAGGYRDQGTGLSIQGYGSTGYGRGGREAEATWGQGGRARGANAQWRAPQGYQRSDQRIYEDLCDRLGGHPYVDPREIRVEVRDRIVTLEGTVITRQEKHMAEDLAVSIPGVEDVRNQLRVGRAQHHPENKSDVVGLPEGSHMIRRGREAEPPAGEPGSRKKAARHTSRQRVRRGGTIAGPGDDAGRQI